MPFWTRAGRSLRKAARCCGSSRSPSPIPSPHPQAPPSHLADSQENSLQATSECQSAPQKPLPALEHCSELPVGPPQETLEDIPNEAPENAPSPDSTPNVQHDEPVTTTADLPHRSQPSTSEDKPNSAWYTALKTTVDLVVQVSDVFPPLKSAAAGVKALMDIHEAFTSNQEEFMKLAERVRFLDKILRGRPPLSGEVEDRRDGLARALEDLGKELEKKTSQSKLERLVSSKEDKQELLRLIREINFAIEFAMLDVAVSNEGMTLRAVEGIDWLKGYLVEESQKKQKDMLAIAHGVAKLNKADQLKKLGNVTGYGLSPDDPQCVAGTRVALIARLLAWAEDSTSDHAFWLSGMAGTGKTAVSRTFCHQLIKRGLLCGSFFCSITVQDLSDVRNIIPSLAKTLAERHSGFGDALAYILESDTTPLVHEMKLSQQYDFLILRPAEIAFCALNKTIVLCADALDECRGPAALKEFLYTILSRRPTGPLKFFFTSRPEVAIKQAVETSPHSSHPKSLRLHDIEEDIVRADIKMYVNHELSKIPELQDEYGECWPPHEVDMIIERADTLFIVAATIVRDIGETGDSVARLQSCSTTMGPAQSGVYSLYQAIMDKALANLRPHEEKDVHLCLSLLVVARRPLSLVEYEALLDRPASAIRAAFRPLHSVVEIPGDARPISIYHASFVDFLTENHTMNTQEMNPPWAVDRQEAHSMVFERCLTLMGSDDREKGVYFGVSGTLTSYKNNEAQLLPQLRSDLAYACTSWGNHVLDGMPLSDALQQGVKSFLVTKGLYWLEALSAQRSVGYSSILWDISKHMTVDGVAALLVNIRDFAQTFATPISHSAPHLYLSALPFHQAASLEPQWWIPLLPSVPIIHTQSTVLNSGRILVDVSKARGLHNAGIRFAISPDGSRLAWCNDETVYLTNMQSGEQVVRPMKLHSDWVTSIAYCCQGSKIASGSKDETILVWDAHNGQALLDIGGHSGRVVSVAFSPDGSKIVSGSWDNTIRVWDAYNGQALMDPIKGHSATVASVAFSPDGTKIVSGSDDMTIRVWDARDGQALLSPIQGHSCSVSTVVFSPDGSKIVSGIDDKTIRVWDARNGRAVLDPIQGHSHWIASVAFSPDGSKIVSGSWDNTIRVWDAHNGQALMDPIQEHLDWVTTVAFSPDSSKIVSASYDKTIRVWDSLNRQALLDPFQGHPDWVTSVVFSPDSSKIASGSYDNTIRIWDARDGQALMDPIRGHSGWVAAVAFSHDGSMIVSGSADSTIRVWDAQNGQAVLDTIWGHSDSVLSVAFSPDGSKIVSGSSDKTIRVWDARNGQVVFDPIRRHSNWVTSVAFSPDGSKIVSGSDYRTIRVWDAQNGQALMDPIRTHYVSSVTFSPDGLRIVAGFDSENASLGLWDALNGQALMATIRGHSDGVRSVTFSPDGSKIVSGSEDKTVRVWDAGNGQLLYRIQGHAKAVNSVAFSPDGSKFASASQDQSIRVWGAGAMNGRPVLTAEFLHDYAYPNLVIGKDGWIRNLSHDLLLWVPPQFRPSLYMSPVQFIIG